MSVQLRIGPARIGGEVALLHCNHKVPETLRYTVVFPTNTSPSCVPRPTFPSASGECVRSSIAV